MLWSGNGVYICQPIEAVVLEQESQFAQFDQPSQTFLKFAAQFLSNHKSDTNNNPAFKSCLLRVAGYYNSKYVEQNKEVKVIQRWNGLRPKANPLYYHFYIYFIIDNSGVLVTFEESKMGIDFSRVYIQECPRYDNQQELDDVL
jgi:hypothetical protein